MTIEQLKNALSEKPFRQLVMHLADGRSVQIQHRELAMMSPSGRTVVVFHPDDSMNIIDLLLVTDLEIATNGSRRRRR